MAGAGNGAKDRADSTGEGASAPRGTVREALGHVERAGKALTAWGTYRPWQHRRRLGATCSHCGGENDRKGQRYCKSCHAAFMREWRKTRPLSGEARAKAISRSYTRVYVRRGKLIQRPCENCGSKESQAHHDDYGKPLQVRWLCRACHLAHHRDEAFTSPRPTVSETSRVALGLRKYRRSGGKECSNCGANRDRNGRYCRKCHAAYMRAYRSLVTVRGSS